MKVNRFFILLIALVLVAMGVLHRFWPINQFIKKAGHSKLSVKWTPPPFSIQNKFIQFMLSRVRYADNRVLNIRRHVLALQKISESSSGLSAPQRQWLKKAADHYQLKKADFSQPQTWVELLKRVDIIPISLMLAQAINESAWGQSRFAKMANNYFGRHCAIPGCGLLPRNRAENASFEVKKYPSALASIEDYIWTLNTHSTYTKFRELRWQMRRKGKPITGIILSQGLSHYSKRGEAYVATLQHIIKSYGLHRYDD